MKPYSVQKEASFVKAKHDNLRDEIIASGFLDATKWRMFVDLKGQKLWSSKRVKKLKAKGLEDEVELTLQHLFSIILYCDFSALCTAFSGTFRRENVFEDEDSVVSRHAEFGIFGKLLVEMVQWFGTNGYVRTDGERGPFFCGINCVLNIGSFAICFNGPCSTSKVRTVALNFATEKGIILDK